MHEFTPVFSLSFHAGYACRHRGACCTAGWPIPVEPDQADALRTARRAGTLTLVPNTAALLMQEAAPSHPLPHGPLLGIVDGACVCFDRKAGGRPAEQGRCRIHRALGHSALPLACRQFPRVCIRDPRGVSVTLSHYCPTAAAMLERAESRATILESAPGFPPDGEYEGLDARANLPPLLRPAMLMDWESWSLWEHLSVACLTDETLTASAALARLATAVELARTWSPGGSPLITHMRDAFARASAIPGPAWTTGPAARAARATAEGDAARRLDEVVSAIPLEFHARFVEPRLAAPANEAPTDVVMRHFLAAHAFANWTAHLGMGLRTWMRSIASAHALVVSGLGVDGADLFLRHLADPAALAQVWSAAETDAP